jgi:hypothetical protein
MSCEKTVWPTFTPHCRLHGGPTRFPLNGRNGGKQLKSKNNKTTTNCHTFIAVAGTQNSSPGQQWLDTNEGFAMDELEGLSLSTGAEMPIFDLANGCKAARTRGGAPSVVMPPSGGSTPKTGGQINDSSVEELSAKRLIHFFGELPSTIQLDAAWTRLLRTFLKEIGHPRLARFTHL